MKLGETLRIWPSTRENIIFPCLTPSIKDMSFTQTPLQCNYCILYGYGARIPFLVISEQRKNKWKILTMMTSYKQVIHFHFLFSINLLIYSGNLLSHNLNWPGRVISIPGSLLLWIPILLNDFEWVLTCIAFNPHKLGLWV